MAASRASFASREGLVGSLALCAAQSHIRSHPSSPMLLALVTQTLVTN